MPVETGNRWGLSALVTVIVLAFMAAGFYIGTLQVPVVTLIPPVQHSTSDVPMSCLTAVDDADTLLVMIGATATESTPDSDFAKMRDLLTQQAKAYRQQAELCREAGK